MNIYRLRNACNDGCGYLYFSKRCIIVTFLYYQVERFWEWSTSRDQVAKGYPLNTTQYFEGLPKAPIGAVRWKDGYIYFFKAEK